MLYAAQIAGMCRLHTPAGSLIGLSTPYHTSKDMVIFHLPMGRVQTNLRQME